MGSQGFSSIGYRLAADEGSPGGHREAKYDQSSDLGPERMEC